ncbi:hypothetical protein Scep_029394 [Stephania cephalantha]|uniref:Uncharacterized protein n=1 Tax=Stephania cephalantha TaxID=152367 RepID=A0AAP0E0W9_9MAGN
MGAQLAGWENIPHEECWRKGPWTAEEDRLLIEYVSQHGEGRWNSVARLAGKNGKSCRLRWVNYLRPDLKRGRITPHEENIILELHARWGNRLDLEKKMASCGMRVSATGEVNRRGGSHWHNAGIIDAA